MNSISIIGAGYVGLVTGTCLSEFGIRVICMDVDAAKIQSLAGGEIPIHEPGLARLVANAVIEANDYQKRRMFEKIETGLKDLSGKTIGILGLAFKPETDDLRAAPSIPIVEALHDRGCHIRIYDPVAMDNAARGALARLSQTGRLIFAADEYDAATGADAVVILTEWNQFRHLDLPRLRSLMAGRHFFDFRNIYERQDIVDLGFIYEAVGR